MLKTWPSRLTLAGTLLAGMAIGVAGWILISPLFIDEVVDEGFPSAAVAGPSDLPTPGELAGMTAVQREARRGDVLTAARAMPDKDMAEPMPADSAEASGPVALAAGPFADVDRVHKGAGTATIYRLEDGASVLRLSDFRVTNGPDLRVIISTHPNPASSDQVHQGFVDLGALKGNVGDQNYRLPAQVDGAQFRSVIIYCRAFGVIFSVAPLTAEQV